MHQPRPPTLDVLSPTSSVESTPASRTPIHALTLPPNPPLAGASSFDSCSFLDDTSALGAHRGIEDPRPCPHCNLRVDGGPCSSVVQHLSTCLHERATQWPGEVASVHELQEGIESFAQFVDTLQLQVRLSLSESLARIAHVAEQVPVPGLQLPVVEPKDVNLLRLLHGGDPRTDPALSELVTNVMSVPEASAAEAQSNLSRARTKFRTVERLAGRQQQARNGATRLQPSISKAPDRRRYKATKAATNPRE